MGGHREVLRGMEKDGGIWRQTLRTQTLLPGSLTIGTRNEALSFTIQCILHSITQNLILGLYSIRTT